MSVTDKLVPEDGEEAKQEGAALSGEQCAETVHKAAEGELLCLSGWILWKQGVVAMPWGPALPLALGVSALKGGFSVLLQL